MTTVAVWWDGLADGPTNMAADECLAAAAQDRNGLVVRIYGWESTTISLGAFQRQADARACDAIAGLPVVRRPSGGGAIVHGSDLTYAAAVPKHHPWGAAPQALYDALHGAMVAEFTSHGIDAALCQTGSGDGDGAPFFCFDRRSVGDVVSGAGTGGIKLMGSAQRRLAGAVVQHGSLLLRQNEHVAAAAGHAGLAGAGGAALAARPRELATAWLRRVAAALTARLDEQPGGFVAGHAALVEAARPRFADERWTSRR